MKSTLFAIATMILAIGCRTSGANDHNKKDTRTIEADIKFDSDSAYAYVERQVAMGPRVPGTPANIECSRYILSELTRHGADSVREQKGKMTAYTGDVLPIINIMGCFNPGARKRILLLAHYDTRPWADRESDPELHNTPIPGANDGGSGTAVLMEIARNLARKAPTVGVDILFVDAEDYGPGETSISDTGFDGWCLGSRYWTQNMIPYGNHNLPAYGILLDMVGGRDAVFHYEYFSQRDAVTPTVKVWSEAMQLGYENIFCRQVGGAVNDDHLVITAAGIPTTDIIESNSKSTGSFPDTWHTLDDNLENIDPDVLDAVGKTVLNVVYKERP